MNLVSNCNGGILIKKLVFIFILAMFIQCVFITPLYAPWIWTPGGGWTNEKDIVKESPKAQWEHADSLEKEGEFNNAARAYRSLIKAYPTSPLAAKSQEKIASCYEREGLLYEAFKAYQKLIEQYPQEIDFDAILKEQYRIGELFISGKKRKLWKFSIIPAQDKGIEILQTIVKNAPYSEIAPQAQFKIGYAYKRMGKLTEAVEAYKKVVEEYSDTPWYEESLYQLGLCNYQKSRGFSYDQAAAKESIEIFQRFLKEFPNSKHIPKVKSSLQQLEGRNAKGLFEIARFYEKHNHNAAAIMYYEEIIEKYPETEEAKESNKRLQKLENKK